MGDRVSVAFRNRGWDNETDNGVTLFNHWGGREFPQIALDYAKRLKATTAKGDKHISTPLSRLEPRVVMVDFIRYLWEQGIAKGKEYNKKMEYVETGFVNESLYFGRDSSDGDNSDNGHWIIDLRTLTVHQQ